MDAATLVRACRRRRGRTLRLLAEQAGTSHSALAAYEAGRKSPNVETLDRILRSAGYQLEVSQLRTEIPDLDERGADLVEVLELAEHFPSRHGALLEAPIFGRP